MRCWHLTNKMRKQLNKIEVSLPKSFSNIIHLKTVEWKANNVVQSYIPPKTNLDNRTEGVGGVMVWLLGFVQLGT